MYATNRLPRLRRVHRSTVRPHHVRLSQYVVSDITLYSCRAARLRELSTHVQVLERIQSAVYLATRETTNRETFTDPRCDVIPPFRERVLECEFSDTFRV